MPEITNRFDFCPGMVCGLLSYKRVCLFGQPVVTASTLTPANIVSEDHRWARLGDSRAQLRLDMQDEQRVNFIIYKK